MELQGGGAAPLPLAGRAIADTAPAATIPGAQVAALVDAVARARQDGQGATVAATLAHGTFGRIDLQFRQKDDGLTVTMASADPGFAPAVLAASRAEAGNGTNQNAANANGAGQNSTGQNNTGQAFAGQSQSQTPSQGQGGDPRQPQRAAAPDSAGLAARRGPDRSDEPDTAQGGVYA